MGILNGTILIAEDDPKTARLVSLYLEKEGFQTLIAKDDQSAIDLAATHQLGFVILDLMLPRVDGWEVCRVIRRTSDVPSIMLTAREDEVDRISGLTLGADDYVVKPLIVWWTCILANFDINRHGRSMVSAPASTNDETPLFAMLR